MKPVSDLLATQIALACAGIENVELKLGQLQAHGQHLVAERQALIDQARVEVGAPPGHLYNLDTRQFQPTAGPTPLSTSARRQAKRAAKKK